MPQPRGDELLGVLGAKSDRSVADSPRIRPVLWVEGG